MNAPEKYARLICKKYGVPIPEGWRYTGPGSTIGDIAKAVLPPEALSLWFDENANDEQKENREAFLDGGK